MNHFIHRAEIFVKTTAWKFTRVNSAFFFSPIESMSSPLDALNPTTVDITVVESSSTEHGRLGRGYAPLWIIAILAFIAFFYVTLQAFPGSWLKHQDPVTSACVVDQCRLYGYSVVIALFLIFLLWIIMAWWC